MRLLQFSTSHYCRKARLALGYKGIDYSVENLTPGLHVLKVKPLTGLTTLPVLLPEAPGEPDAIADSTRIFHYLEANFPEPPLVPRDRPQALQARLLEDWLDESIGTAARFVYYQYRANEGQQLDPSLVSRAVIAIVRRQYGISATSAALAAERLDTAIAALDRWKTEYLVGANLSLADLAAAALLSPLLRLPHYRDSYPWLGDCIAEIHRACNEPLPPGLDVPAPAESP